MPGQRSKQRDYPAATNEALLFGLWVICNLAYGKLVAKERVTL